MNRSACALRSLASAWLLLAALRAQAPAVDPDEFVRLEPVLQAAIQRAAPPWTVTVETFGGTRRVMGEDGEFDGDAPPKPKQRPKKQPEPDKKEGEPKDEQDPKDGKGEKGEKPDLPLVAPGFAQAQGRTTGVVIRSDGAGSWCRASHSTSIRPPCWSPFPAAARSAPNASAKTRAAASPRRRSLHATCRRRPCCIPTRCRSGNGLVPLGRTFAVDEPTVHRHRQRQTPLVFSAARCRSTPTRRRPTTVVR